MDHRISDGPLRDVATVEHRVLAFERPHILRRLLVRQQAVHGRRDLNTDSSLICHSH